MLQRQGSLLLLMVALMEVFSRRMLQQADALARRLDQGGSLERRDLSTQLLTLSKCVDHAVASNQKPSPMQDTFFQQLKKFADFRYDEMLRPSIMVLMLSVKSACLAGWFKETDTEELREILHDLVKHFQLDGECSKPPSEVAVLSGPDVNDTSEHESFIKVVCDRYFPTMMVAAVVVSLVVKTGYEVRGCDFQITQQLALNTKVRLFVCEKNDVGTSKCLVTPPLLSFLVNGKGVEKRVYLPVGAEIGPQLPSDVTSSCRLGGNFLQAVGECTGSYVVAVVLMGPSPSALEERHLEDYVNPEPSAETDDEVIVGRSRISLRCPISHKRIINPVKGVSCRHHQAFDCKPYLDINERRPSWRCPCCNGYVNFSELRRDKRMEQILRDVEDNVFDIAVHQDGSWAIDADECDVARETVTNESSGEARIIVVSSDDEEDGGDGEAAVRLATPGDPFSDRAAISGTTSSTVDVEDRKPDIRSMQANWSSSGNTAVSTGAPSRVVMANVSNAVYSALSENPNMFGSNASIDSPNLSSGSAERSAHDYLPQSWIPVQQSAGNVASWSGSVLTSQPAGQSSNSRVPRPNVIQAVPGSAQYASSNRSRFSGQAGNNTGVIGYLPLPLEQEVQAMQMQMQNSDIADMRMMHDLRQHSYAVNPARQHPPNDSSQHGQGHGPRVFAQQGAGVQQRTPVSTREARTYLYTGTGLQQTGQGQQNADLLTQSSHHTPLYRLVQQAQATNSRASPSGMPLANGGSLHSPGGGLHQHSVARQGQHPTHPSGTSPVVQTAVAANESSLGRSGWVPAQASNWRSTGAPRMRGAIGTTSSSAVNANARAGNTGATQLAAPVGPVNRVRAPSSASSMLPATVAQMPNGVPGMSWVAHGNVVHQGIGGGSGSAEFHTVPESLSSPPSLDDVQWPPSAVESLGHWPQLDDLMSGSPPLS